MQIKTLRPLDGRVPSWNYDELEWRQCPICNADHSKPLFIRPDDLTVHECSDCSTLYINPAPSVAQLTKFYENYYDQHADLSKNSVEKFAYETKLIEPISDIRINRLLSIIGAIQNGKFALDIGCGRGQFLHLLRKIGYIVEGIEPDISSLKFAKKLGITSIFAGYIEDFYTDKKYDLVTLLDLIEHPLKPISLISLALNHMKPGGFLLIWTPNGASDNVDLNNLTFRVDLEHMQYLTKKSCEHVAALHNLKIIHFETLGTHEGFEFINNSIDPTPRHNSHITLIGLLKKLITKIPFWYSAINPFLRRKKHETTILEAPNKNYHLLCILQKPSNSTN